MNSHILTKPFPARFKTNDFARFTSLLEGSTYDEEGIRYELPSHIYSEESSQW